MPSSPSYEYKHAGSKAPSTAIRKSALHGPTTHKQQMSGLQSAQVVEPKIEKLRESEAELKVATKERQQVEDELAVVQSKLDEMQAQFDAAMAQKQVGVVWVMHGRAAAAFEDSQEQMGGGRQAPSCVMNPFPCLACAGAGG